MGDCVSSRNDYCGVVEQNETILRSHLLPVNCLAGSYSRIRQAHSANSNADGYVCIGLAKREARQESRMATSDAAPASDDWLDLCESSVNER